MDNSKLKLTLVNVDLCAVLSALQVAMVLNDQNETTKRLEKLRYCETVIEHTKEVIKELNK